jgi:hypothetical protein
MSTGKHESCDRKRPLGVAVIAPLETPNEDDYCRATPDERISTVFEKATEEFKNLLTRRTGRGKNNFSRRSISWRGCGKCEGAEVRP